MTDHDVTQTTKSHESVTSRTTTSHEPLPFWPLKHPKLLKIPVDDNMEHDITQTLISNDPMMSKTETSHKLMPFWIANIPKKYKDPVPNVTNCNITQTAMSYEPLVSQTVMLHKPLMSETITLFPLPPPSRTLCVLNRHKSTSLDSHSCKFSFF